MVSESVATVTVEWIASGDERISYVASGRKRVKAEIVIALLIGIVIDYEEGGVAAVGIDVVVGKTGAEGVGLEVGIGKRTEVIGGEGSGEHKAVALYSRKDGIEEMHLCLLLPLREVADIEWRHLIITQDRLNSVLSVVEERSYRGVDKLMFATCRIDAVLGTIGYLRVGDERIDILQNQPIYGAVMNAAVEQGKAFAAGAAQIQTNTARHNLGMREKCAIGCGKIDAIPFAAYIQIPDTFVKIIESVALKTHGSIQGAASRNASEADNLSGIVHEEMAARSNREVRALVDINAAADEVWLAPKQGGVVTNIEAVNEFYIPTIGFNHQLLGMIAHFEQKFIFDKSGLIAVLRTDCGTHKKEETVASINAQIADSRERLFAIEVDLERLPILQPH